MTVTVNFQDILCKAAKNPFEPLNISQYVSPSIMFSDSSHKTPFLPYAIKDIPKNHLLLIERGFSIVWPAKKTPETTCCSLCSLRSAFESEISLLNHVQRKALFSRLSAHALPTNPSSEDLHQFVIEHCFPLTHSQYHVHARSRHLFRHSPDEGRGIFMLASNIPVACVPNTACFTIADCLFIVTTTKIKSGSLLLLPVDSRPGLDCLSLGTSKCGKMSSGDQEKLYDVCAKCNYEISLSTKSLFEVCSLRAGLYQSITDPKISFDQTYSNFQSVASQLPQGLPYLQIDAALCRCLRYIDLNFPKAVRSLQFAYQLSKTNLGFYRRRDLFLKLIRMVAIEYSKKDLPEISDKWTSRLLKLTIFPFNLSAFFDLYLTNYVDLIELPSILSILEDEDCDSYEDPFEDSVAMNKLAELNQNLKNLKTLKGIKNMTPVPEETKETINCGSNQSELITNQISDPDSKKSIFSDLCNRFKILLFQRRFVSLLSVLGRIPLDQSNPVLNFFSAICYQACGQFETSIEIFNALSKISNESPMSSTINQVIKEAMYGNFDLASIFEEYSTDPYSGCLHSEYRSKLIKVNQSPPNGLGISAVEDIKVGEFLLVERALITQFPNSEDDVSNQNIDPLSSIARKIQHLEDEIPENLKISLLSSPCRVGWSNIVKKLKKEAHKTPSLNTIKKSLESNLFPLSHRQFCFHPPPKETSLGGFGVFLTASRFSHTCAPNAVYFTVGDLIFIRVVKPISKGESVSIRRIVSAPNGEFFPCSCCVCKAEIESNDNKGNSFTLLKKVTKLLFSSPFSSSFDAIFDRFRSTLDSMPSRYPPLSAEAFTRAAQFKVSQFEFEAARDYLDIAFQDLLLPESSGVDVLPFIEVCVSLIDYYLDCGNIQEISEMERRIKKLVILIGIDGNDDALCGKLVKQMRIKKQSDVW
ncbi:hypothetical protein P9112_007603 [Eukaryota sp. TZLM1-RC]